MYDLLRKYINEVTSSVISDEEFKFLEQAFSPKIIRKKQFLLHEGAICKYLGFIVKGAMRQYTIDDKGNEHIIRFGIEGWWMSDRESFVMLTPSKYNIDALEDCELLVITNEQIALLKEQSPLFVKMGVKLDERSFITSQHRIEASMSYTAEEKYLHLSKTYPAFLERFPQNMLASYLGLSPETLSRVRKQVLSNK
jgi:CRP-like cAMP-binding protein